ncbi:MAG: phage tail sheath family protein, partial [Cyanophyceae cyanobacterium]
MARLDYFAPGVYIEEVDRGSRPIDGVSTNVGGFVGFTEDVRNGAELSKPMLITTWTQYLYHFARPRSDGFTDFNAYLPFAVYGFFLNGGGRCWVTSIGTQLPGSPTPPPTESGLQIQSRTNRPALNFSIRPERASEGSLIIAITESGPRQLGDGTESTANSEEFFAIEVQRDGGEVLERFENLTMDPEVQTQVGTYVLTAVESSEYV